MAILLTIDQQGLEKLSRYGAAVQKQLPFATSQALNALAKGLKAIPGSDTNNIVTALKGASKGYFRDPTPFIVNAWTATKSTKADLTVIIHPQEKRVKYLKAHITGGDRTYKRYEAKLLGLSDQPTQVLIPSFVKTNAAGNVTRGTIGKIIQAQTTKGPGSVLVGRPRGGARPVGVYERTKQGTLKPLFVAQDSASYRGNFPLERTAWTVQTRRFNGYLFSALEKALSSAR